MKNISALVCFIIVAIVCISIASVNVVAQEGPIAEYHFDENSGTTLGDSSGNNNNGTIHGATWTDGISGSALNFDGIDDYVDLGHLLDNPSVSVPNGTVEVWFRPEHIIGPENATMGGLFCKYTTTWGGMLLRLDYTGRMTFWNQQQGTSARLDSEIQTWYPQWYQVVIQWGHSGMKMYLNGELVNETSYTGVWHEPHNLKCAMGSVYCSDFNSIGPNHTFNGSIDEVRVYDRVLSADEILEHYQEHSQNETPGFEVLTILLATVISIALIKVRRNSK